MEYLVINQPIVRMFKDSFIISDTSLFIFIGIASIKGHFPSFDDERSTEYTVIGPMTRYAKDLRLVMNVIVDPEHKATLKINEKVRKSKKYSVFHKSECIVFYLNKEN